MRVRHFGLVLAAMLPIAWPARGADQPASIVEARQALKNDDFAAAITSLERSLPNAKGSELHLALLRQAYRGEIRKRVADGDQATAQKYMDRLELLERSIQSVGMAASPQDPPLNARAAAAAEEQVKVIMPGQPAQSSDTRQLAAQAPPTNPGWRRSSQPIARRPNPLLQKELTSAAARDSFRAASVPPKPKAAAARINSAQPPFETKLQSQNTSTRSLVTQADALFLARRYDEAAKLYEQAGRRDAGSLDDEKDRWAYCRLARVIGRINDEPATAADWSAIQGEVASIVQLIPNNEFARSLLVMAEREAQPGGPRFAAGAKPEPNGDAIIRASEPDRAEPKPSNLLADLAARIGLASKNAAGKRPWQRSRSGKWQVLETSNFRVHFTDENMGGQAADLAEATRIELYRTWFGKLPESNWSPKCDIFIHDSTDEYTRVTRQGPGSPGHSQTGIDRGRINSRRIDLRRDGPDLIRAVLPHEITHVVLADRFSAKPMPRWADEGVAVLTEPVEKKNAHLRNLGDISRQGRLFTARQLMTMGDYPPGNQWPAFYAESVSLVEFLVSRGGTGKFIEFMERSQQTGYEAELKRVYGLAGFDELDRAWSRDRVEQVAAATN